MRSEGRRRLFVAIVGLCALSATVTAQTAVPVWEKIFRPEATGTTSSAPIAVRELADGTVLVVTYSLLTIHYDHNGNVLSATQLSAAGGGYGTSSAGPRKPAASAQRAKLHTRLSKRGSASFAPGDYGQAYAAIDAFGRVVVTMITNPSFPFGETGDIETTKFDGLTGEALWNAPAIQRGGTFHAVYPTGVFVDPRGDVVVTGRGVDVSEHLTLKYEGKTGQLIWGPAILSLPTPGAGASTAVMDRFGNVFVSVPQAGSNGLNIATLKYANLDGAIVWGPVVFSDGEFASTAARACTVDFSGDLYVTGESRGAFLTLKYNGSSGALLWTHRFAPQGSAATGTTLSLDASGNVVLAGRFSPEFGAEDYAVLKIGGATGATLWGPVEIVSARLNQPPSLGVFGNGDVLLGAFVGSDSAADLDFWRYRGSDGSLEWGEKRFGISYDSNSPASTICSNGRVFVAASFSSGVLNSGELDGATGDPAWGPSPFTAPYVPIVYFDDLAEGPDGNPVVLGDTFETIRTIKYDKTNGDLLWTAAPFGGTGTIHRGWQTAVNAQNDVLVMGVTDQAPSGLGTEFLKYSGSTGALLWGPVTLDGLSPTEFGLDAAGNPTVLASTYDPNSSFAHSSVTKLSGVDGSVLWGPVVYVSDPNETDYPEAIAIGANGDVGVIGASSIFTGDYVWFTFKYDGATGAALWGPAPGLVGAPFAVGLNAVGDLAVTGYGPEGMATFSFDGATGAPLWGPMIVPAEFNASQGVALVVGSTGDVFAAGDVYSSATSYDFATIKYRGSDGIALWGPRLFDGDAHGTDYVYQLGLGLDSAENVVVGGNVLTRQNGQDIGVLKYDGASGTTLWGPVEVGTGDNQTLLGFSVRGEAVAVGARSFGALLTAYLNESLGIETSAGMLTPFFCGEFGSIALIARNGATPYAWSLVSGSLPNGLSLSTTGILSGVPVEQGTFVFRTRVDDSAGGSAERDFSVIVQDDSSEYSISAALIADCGYELSVFGAWTSYLWLPGGETTSTIDVAPIETTTYGVVVGDGSGCLRHLSITIAGTALQNPLCLAPTVKAVLPSSGPASGGVPVTIVGGNFQPGAQLEIGGQATGATLVDPTQITATTPAMPPGTLNDVVVVNPDSGNAALLNGFFADFLDVPPSNIFHDSIERLFRRGVTAGCDAGTFCPDAHTTRAQIAVFLLKSLLGATYVPPAATGAIFIDVFPGVFAADWIEDLYGRGITGGCQASPLAYCPDADVTRAEMAVFLLKTLLGSDYVPPAATGTVFEDVSADAFAAAWIEDLYHRGLTAGCQASPLRYCPDAAVTRGEMAAFLVNTFGL